MITFEDRLQEIVRELLERGGFDAELKGRLSAYLEEEGGPKPAEAGPRGPVSTARYGRAETAQILRLCADGAYVTAWERFVRLEGYLRERGWMGLLEGDLYRLGAFIAGRCGNREEENRLARGYEAYRARYVESFGGLVLRAVEEVWSEPGRAEELEAVLFGGFDSVRDAGLPSWLESWLGGLAQRARVMVASLGGVAPAPVVAAAGAVAGRQEVEGEGEGVRWKVVREEDGGLWVWVETEEVGVEKVVVGIGEEGAGEPVVRVEVRLVSLGGGRCGGLAFVGRWEDLGLVGRPVVVLGVVEGGVR
jgi:hypothetical protein